MSRGRVRGRDRRRRGASHREHRGSKHRQLCVHGRSKQHWGWDLGVPKQQPTGFRAIRRAVVMLSFVSDGETAALPGEDD